MDIYWVKDKRKCGPSTVPDVISMVRTGELTADALGWHAGCGSWLPLRELPALADFLNEQDATAPETTPELPAEQGEGTSAEPAETPAAAEPPLIPLSAATPAARLVARLADVSLYLALIYLAIYARHLPYSPNLMPDTPFFWLAFIALEAALLHLFGTTPGKWLMGIRVVSPEGDRVGYLRALNRSIMVFVGGMGMMISILPFVMSAIAYVMLRKRGTTFWDARSLTFPVQTASVGAGRFLLAVLVIIICLHLFSFCVQPWLPDMIEAIRTQSPELGRLLQQLSNAQPQ